jgi:hypothetical protein
LSLAAPLIGCKDTVISHSNIQLQEKVAIFALSNDNIK